MVQQLLHITSDEAAKAAFDQEWKGSGCGVVGAGSGVGMSRLTTTGSWPLVLPRLPPVRRDGRSIPGAARTAAHKRSRPARLRLGNISRLSFSNTPTVRGHSISRSIRQTGTTRLTIPSSTRSSRNSTTGSEATSWTAPQVRPGIPFITCGRVANVSSQSSTTLPTKILRSCERISKNIRVRFTDISTSPRVKVTSTAARCGLPRTQGMNALF
jgi:hypothetical protein